MNGLLLLFSVPVPILLISKQTLSMTATITPFADQDDRSTSPSCACEWPCRNIHAGKSAIGAICTVAGNRLLVAISLAPRLLGSKNLTTAKVKVASLSM